MASAPPSLEEVQNAVSTLYHDNDPDRRRAADAWLTQLKSSEFAGLVGQQLIHCATTAEVRFLGATLITAAAKTVSRESRSEFCVGVLGCVARVPESFVITKLCAAVSSVAVCGGKPPGVHPVVAMCTSAECAAMTPAAILELLAMIADAAEDAMSRAVNTSQVSEVNCQMVCECDE